MVRMRGRFSMSLHVERRRQKRVHARRRWSSSSPSSSSPSPSPSPPRVEELKKSICFWGYNEQQETEWYVFDVSDIRKSGGFIGMDNYKERALNKIRETSRLPEGIAFLPRHLHLGGGEKNKNSTSSCGRGELIPFSVTQIDTQTGRCVAMGSVIYRFGGDDDRLDSVVCCHILDSCGGGWRNCPPMRTPRYRTRVVALDGKIYVMGGGETQKSGPWAEVYDPCFEKWESLPPPPSQSPRPPIFVAAVEASKKIVVSFYDSRELLHAYDLTTSSWEEIDGFSGASCAGRATVVDHTAYYIHGDMLIALDFERNVWFMGRINGLEDDFVIQHNSDAGVFPTLLHLSGDKFCVFYVDRLTNPILSHCVKIRISKCDNRVLDAFVESCQSYKIDHMVTFMDAILLDGRFISEKKLVDESASTKVVSKIEGGKLSASGMILYLIALLFLFVACLLVMEKLGSTETPLGVVFDKGMGPICYRLYADLVLGVYHSCNLHFFLDKW